MKAQSIKRIFAVMCMAVVMVIILGAGVTGIGATELEPTAEITAVKPESIVDNTEHSWRRIVFAPETDWELIGPGGGGQIQYLYPVPGVDGRLFWLSDMEGLFRSDDNGATWNFVGEDVRAGHTYVVATDPSNPDRVYLGMRSGLAVSTDGGIHWYNILPETHPGAPPNDENIATLAVHGDTVLAGPSWHEDDGGFGRTGTPELRTGERIIYKSTDAGDTWTHITYADPGYRQVFDIEIDPTDPNVVYMGADAGVFKSTDMGDTWTLIAPPADLPAGNSRGIALSPDGEFLYATYPIAVDEGQNPDESRGYVRRTSVFVTHTDDLATWVQLNTGLADSVIGFQNTDYWRPEMNPRSTATNHELIIGPLNGDNIGLHYGEFTAAVNDDGSWEVSGSWDKIFENRPGESPRVMPGEQRGFNMGVQPKSRHYAWTPVDWAEEKIWLGDQQSVFKGQPDMPNDWETISSIFVDSTADPEEDFYPSSMNYTPHFKHVGVHSTFSYDNAAYENYVVQGQADNGLLESWDGGETWTQRFFDMENYYLLFESLPYEASETHWNGTGVGGFANYWYYNNVDSLAVIPTDPPIMLGGLGFFFGGGHHNQGFLIANRMETMSPEDTWQYLGGSAWERVNWFYANWWDAFWDPMYWPKNGLPDARILTINYNPDNPNQVVVGTHAGLYMIDDIVARVYDQTGSFASIGTEAMGSESFRYVSYDPNDTNVIYAMSAPYNPSGAGGWGELLGEGFVRRGEWNGSGWDWTDIMDRGGAGNSGRHDMQVWDYDGTTYIAVTLPSDDELGEESTVYISTDQGATWEETLTLTDAVRLGPDGPEADPVKDWYDPDFHDLTFSAVGGYDNHIFAALGDHGAEKGYGFYHGIIRRDGSVYWEDWAGSYEYGESYMYYPDARRMHVFESEEGDTYLYVSTMGTGVWRRAFQPDCINHNFPSHWSHYWESSLAGRCLVFNK